jgi:hypothetical protein
MADVFNLGKLTRHFPRLSTLGCASVRLLLARSEEWLALMKTARGRFMKVAAANVGLGR